MSTGKSIDDRRREAAHKLAERLTTKGGVSSEKAHQKAAEVAREADKRKDSDNR